MDSRIKIRPQEKRGELILLTDSLTFKTTYYGKQNNNPQTI